MCLTQRPPSLGASLREIWADWLARYEKHNSEVPEALKINITGIKARGWERNINVMAAGLTNSVVMFSLLLFVTD